MLKRIFKEPLVHFLLLGALLFIVFEVFGTTDAEGDKMITITQAQVETIRAGFTRTWQRPPTAAELEGLVEEHIRDEVAYREALAMGLDREDPYIRRRLRMKIDLMLEDMSELMPPAQEELTAFLDQHREVFRREPSYHFSQVYLDPQSRSNSLQQDADRLLEQLAEAGPDIDLVQYGDPTMLPLTVSLSPASVVDRTFGNEFSEQLAGLAVGTWQGPVQSSYGYHLVRVHEYIPGRDPDFSEIRDVVEREFMAQRRKEVKEKTYARLSEGYRVVMEEKASEQQ